MRFKDKLHIWYRTRFCGDVIIRHITKVDDNLHYDYVVTHELVEYTDEIMDQTLHCTGEPYVRAMLHNIDIPDYYALDGHSAVEGDLFLNTNVFENMLSLKWNEFMGHLDLKKVAIIMLIIVGVAIGLWIFKGSL